MKMGNSKLNPRHKDNKKNVPQNMELLLEILLLNKYFIYNFKKDKHLDIIAKLKKEVMEKQPIYYDYYFEQGKQMEQKRLGTSSMGPCSDAADNNEVKAQDDDQTPKK